MSAQADQINIQSPLGIVAGNGTLPLEIAKEAKLRDIQTFAVLHKGETDIEMQNLVSDYRWVRLGQLGKILQFFRSSRVRDVIFAGGIRRTNLFTGLRPDWTTIRILGRIKSLKDDSVLRAAAAEIERQGMRVISASQILPSIIAPAGLISDRPLSEQELRDARVGWEAAKHLGQMDVGQSVCVLNGLVLAREAIQGTDRCMQRAFDLGGSSGTLVKICKPNQDQRMDLPTVGPGTIEKLIATKGTALVIEAGKTLILDLPKTKMLADKASISIFATDEP